jgi:thymidylate synthase (FAD)
MPVKLTALTQPTIKAKDGDDYLSAEEFISYCARVSNPTNQLNTETAPKLLKYLIEHKHWSPYEMVSATFEIKTSRAIAAQILRHRSFSFQEFSQRYASTTGLEDIEWRLQGKTNRQVGEEQINLLERYPDVAVQIARIQQDSIQAYSNLIDKGIAKECARMVLPLNTTTTLYMTGSIRSWIHYLDLRTKSDTQKEHRDIALAIQSVLKEQFPNTSEALSW